MSEQRISVWHRAVLAVLVAGFWSTSALAQDEDNVLEEVMVTGSRANFSTADDAPVPVSVLTNEMLTNTGATELGRAIQAAAPSFNFSSSSISDGTDALRPATLRGLGPDQTLVLINGKRRHTSALIHVNTSVGRGTAGTDMNAIPISAVKRVEVLRDGAAAQYGSDAIAGVINIILKDSATDGLANLEYGETFEGDGETWVANANTGFALGSDGFLNLTYQYRDRGATNRAGLDGTRQYPCTDGTNIDFGCTIKTLDPREATFDRNSFRIGDADNQQHSFVANMAITAGSGEIYSFLTYSTRDNQSGGFTRTASNATGNVLSIYPDGFLPLINTDIEDLSLFAGYRWETASGWGFDLSGGYGDNDFGFLISNSLNASFGASSPTSADAGTLVLDQTTFNFDASKLYDQGSVPFNVAWGAEYRDEGYQIKAGEPVSYQDGGQKNPFTGQNYAPGFQVFRGFSPAEAVSRSRDSWALYTDLESQLTDKFLLTGALRYEDFSDFGSTTNWKVSGRFDVIDSFAIRAAANTGFRAPSMQQQFFNSISTQFVSKPGVEGLVPEERGTFRNDSAVAAALGIPKLSEEQSDNYSLGFIWNPLDNVSLTVDYFQVDIEDRIVLSGAISATNAAIPVAVRNVLLANNIGAAQFFTNAGKTTTDGFEVVFNWSVPTDNGGMFRLDASAAFISTDVSGDVNTDGLLAGLENVIFVAQDRSIIEEWQPDNRASTTASYAIGNWMLLGRINYYGEYTVEEGDGSRQTFGSEWFPDAMVEYGFGDSGFAVQVGANNFTDTTPDKNLIGQSRGGSIPGIVDSPGVFTFSRRAAPFGFNGGYWYMKAIYRF